LSEQHPGWFLPDLTISSKKSPGGFSILNPNFGMTIAEG
jgi:hypothetical protein